MTPDEAARQVRADLDPDELSRGLDRTQEALQKVLYVLLLMWLLRGSVDGWDTYGGESGGGDWELNPARAAAWTALESRAASMSVVDTTVARIRDAVKIAIRDGKTYGELFAAVTGLVSPDADEPQYRTKLILETEWAWAWRHGELEAAMAAGAIYKIWHTRQDPLVCAFCDALEGTRVAVDSPYLEPGTAIEASGHTFTVSDYGHLLVPQLHPNCRCWAEYVFPTRTEP